MSSANRHDKGDREVVGLRDTTEQRGSESVGARQEQRVARVVLVTTRRGAVTTPLRGGQRCSGGYCHGCAVEPQRRQAGPNEPAGRRAGANWWAHHEAWAGKKRVQSPGTGTEAGGTEQTRERRVSPGGAGGQHLTSRPAGEPPSLSKIDPRRVGARLGTGDREQE